MTSARGTPLSIHRPFSTRLFVWRHRRRRLPKHPPEMVSFRREASSTGGQMFGAAHAEDALTAAQRQRGRLRKQKLRTLFSDFEDDSLPSPNSFRTNLAFFALENQRSVTGELSSWFLQYGDVGFKIQREKETQFFPCNSLARQPQLTAEARCKLVSWLIPVHKHFRLSFECCCLSVNIMDRFLASTPIAVDCFQLLGVTALLLATKLVEIGSPSVSHLLSLCCDAFTKEQLYNLERLILLRLNFHFTAPTLAFFLDYFTNCIEADARFKNNCSGTSKTTYVSSFAQKVCELTLADYAFNKYPPSLTASCAMRLASEFLQTYFAGTSSMQSQDNLVDGFTDEGSTVSLQLLESDGASEMDLKDCFLSMMNFNHNLMEECQENMKLLVSLNGIDQCAIDCSY
ncbi:cyclin-O [Oryzias latipes]|uniref:G2/mitotic-specific cyclin-B2 n=1 Tax=Oryzias latipes TaxID=8090 RepID=A0A3B3HL35_ORYLA|nr:cyclin-O [Oryzias latipes]